MLGLTRPKKVAKYQSREKEEGDATGRRHPLGFRRLASLKTGESAHRRAFYRRRCVRASPFVMRACVHAHACVCRPPEWHSHVHINVSSCTPIDSGGVILPSDWRWRVCTHWECSHGCRGGLTRWRSWIGGIFLGSHILTPKFTHAPTATWMQLTFGVMWAQN